MSNIIFLEIPKQCPICEGHTLIQKANDTEVLVCTNPDCSGKLLGRFTHFVSKKGMDIAGLSEATLELLISKEYLKEFKDIYALSTHSNELAKLTGLGPKSVEKLLQSIENSRKVKLENFICALGIPNIGLSASKTISKYCEGSYNAFHHLCAQPFKWEILDDFGEISRNSIWDYVCEHLNEMDYLSDEMSFIVPEKQQIAENPFTGKILVVTGKLNHFTRDSINEKIASLGAKTAGSVSKKTDFLLTNEASGSSKYKKAIELGIPVITEDEFLQMISID